MANFLYFVADQNAVRQLKDLQQICDCVEAAREKIPKRATK